NRPSGAPTGGRPSGGGGGGFGNIANGKVTALSATSMAVQVLDRTTNATSTDTVTLTPSTTYTETGAAASTALQVGECVTATGTANSTGTVAASRIALSAAGPNGCSIGFGRRPGANPSASSAGA
ncbi:MAG: hypothetical protein QOI26_24, partial [Pseudonocardiales bacterium]|nr:hypothetical protein [Pseudonocardiales bacterium]